MNFMIQVFLLMSPVAALGAVLNVGQTMIVELQAVDARTGESVFRQRLVDEPDFQDALMKFAQGKLSQLELKKITGGILAGPERVLRIKICDGAKNCRVVTGVYDGRSPASSGVN